MGPPVFIGDLVFICTFDKNGVAFNGDPGIIRSYMVYTVFISLFADFS